ncbi:MAG TPA: arylsulfotransferase family protein [Solirubrobacteraceae bacterium]|nr:arylsulfotransferase family protein [Solirubrobacteraceae bacterium]
MTAISPSGSPQSQSPPRRLLLVRLLLVAIVIGCFAGLGMELLVGAAPGTVSVFPVPGDRVASPDTQIAFRGVPISQLGRIEVTGSRSGRHEGRLLADSDGHGGSFLPRKPFLPGELVTVRTHLHVRGGRRGTFRFTVADPAGAIPLSALGPAPRVAGDLDSFRSAADLSPPAVDITTPSTDPGEGEIFLTPQQGPVQNGPMIIAPSGDLIWFDPLPKGEMAADLRVQRYHGRPVLTWWQGYSGAGLGLGEDVIDNSSYRQIAVVHAANGLSADLHEFTLTRQGTALVTAYYPVHWNLSSVKGPAQGIVLDSVVQEIDIKTGLLLFQWDSLDHVPLTDSYEPLPGSAGQPYDYFHINSIQQQRDGSLIISARNTWAAYKVSSRTGRVIWTLGGKHSTFALGSGAAFAFQHSVRLRSRSDSVVVFDDGAGPPVVHNQSRALTLTLDPRRKTVRVARVEEHSPPLLASFEGDVQPLQNGDQFVGWGQQPYFTEFNARGQVVFDGRFVDANSSYRAYRYQWSATPQSRPAVAASTSGGATAVYVSWNGATTVAAWRVLSGATPQRLSPVKTGRRAAFETELVVPAVPYVAVEALDARGRVLARSATVHPS